MAESGTVSFDRQQDGTLVVRLAGSWLMRHGAPAADPIEEEVSARAPRRVVFDAAGLGEWDSAVLMTRSSLGHFVLFTLLSCCVAACTLLQPQPDLTQFFVLTPLAPSNPGGAGADEPLVGVGPITVPEYLDRTNIVRRFAPNRVAISELEWWAEPLDTSLLRVIGDNLAARLSTPAVLRYPWPLLMKPGYSVAINFSRFDILSPERVHLSARWVVRGGQPRRALLTRESSLEKSTAGPGTADAVAALSQILDDLSAEIASAIQTLRVEAPPPPKTPRPRR